MKVTDKFHFLLSWWQKIGCVIHERIDLGLIVTNLAQPLNYINARKNVFGFDQKNFVHILYIFTAIISSFFVYLSSAQHNVSTFHWADCLIWCSRERCQKHPKSTQNLWIFYATYNVWRENTQVLASPSFKRHVMSKRSFLYHLVLKYSFRWQLEYDLSLFLWMLSNSFAHFQTLAILDISKQIYQFCNIILGASIDDQQGSFLLEKIAQK